MYMFGRNKQIKDVIEDGHKRKRKDMEGAKIVSNAGIQRFSELVAVVESKRFNEESKLLEEEIIKEYRNVFYGNSIIGNSGDGNEMKSQSSSKLKLLFEELIYISLSFLPLSIFYVTTFSSPFFLFHFLFYTSIHLAEQKRGSLIKPHIFDPPSEKPHQRSLLLHRRSIINTSKDSSSKEHSSFISFIYIYLIHKNIYHPNN